MNYTTHMPIFHKARGSILSRTGAVIWLMWSAAMRKLADPSTGGCVSTWKGWTCPFGTILGIGEISVERSLHGSHSSTRFLSMASDIIE